MHFYKKKPYKTAAFSSRIQNPNFIPFLNFSFCCPATKRRDWNRTSWFRASAASSLWGGSGGGGGPSQLAAIRAWVAGGTAGVPGVLLGGRELGANLEAAGPRGAGRGRAAWCGAPWTEALCGGRSRRPGVAPRRWGEGRAGPGSESAAGGRGSGGGGRTPRR